MIQSGTGNAGDIDVTSIHYDSRTVKEGGLFVAVKGLAADGHDYIMNAVSKGAVAVIVQKEITGLSVPALVVTDSRKALALLSARFFGNPSERLHVTGVTGTNGKTSITYLIESIFNEAGYITGVIGTINFRYGDTVIPNPMTTPDSLELQTIMGEMEKAGVTHVIMEVSSHAVDLDRIYGMSFDTAVFTNLTQDHLDYHESMDAYFDCKKRLFTEYLAKTAPHKKATAVINIFDPNGLKLADHVQVPILKTGTPDSDIRLEDGQLDIKGTRGTLVTPKGRITISSSAIGRHNLENILNAAGAALAANAPLDAVRKGIEHFRVPGRLERIDNTKGFDVFVDYAHTPDGLKNVLETVRPLTPGRVITVFGCGGDRDKGKRPKMGKISETYSDLTIVTLDNPRTEDPESIIRHILDGMDSTFIENQASVLDFNKGVTVHTVEPDRKTAIRLAIRSARPGDCVLIAGKGHETYQIFKTKTIDFDDRTEARKVLEAHE
jgi:UDP-N-acetylmuramyl-tripeptide synthetase